MSADILTTLALLGDTPDAIAATLANKGCTGLPYEAELCPVSTFLVEQGCGWASVAVGAILWGDDLEAFAEVDTPAPVAEFVRRFDRGYYPELEATDA